MTAFRFIAGSVALVGALAATGCGQTASPTSGDPVGRHEQALSASLVISAVYGGGSATGAAYKNDYVELFNRSSTPYVLTGGALQYSRTDRGPWQVLALPATVTIPPGGYYLIKLFAPATTVGADLPTPDFTENTLMDGGLSSLHNYGTTNGMVALTSNTTQLTCWWSAADGGASDATGSGCDSTAVIDLVGYGQTASGTLPAAPVYEGAGQAPSGSATNAMVRKNSGCTETDNNSTDFEAVAHVPKNSMSTATVCALADAAVDVAVDVTVDVAVDAPVDVPVDVAVDAGGDVKTDSPTPTDTGTAPTDTGTAPEDTGTPDFDTGTTPPADTGSATVDTGTPATDEVLEDDGCGCRVAGGNNAQLGAAMVGLFFALGAIARRRR
jgi:hypothetical protein